MAVYDVQGNGPKPGPPPLPVLGGVDVLDPVPLPDPLLPVVVLVGVTPPPPGEPPPPPDEPAPPPLPASASATMTRPPHAMSGTPRAMKPSAHESTRRERRDGEAMRGKLAPGVPGARCADARRMGGSMQLLQARVVGLGPLDDVTFPFADDAGIARAATVVLGGGGVGKTSLLAAIASTRPGHAVAQRPRRAGEAPFVVTEWSLGAEDPARPHPLRVASPNAALGEAEDVAMLRRREQSLFERRAGEGGFALVAFSGGRWFSRAPIVLGGAERAMGRHDPRVVASFDDPTRANLARETKQALAYPAVATAVAGGTSPALAALDVAMRGAVAPLARVAGYAFEGVDAVTLEPVFTRLAGGAVPLAGEAAREAGGAAVPFDELPAHARHLVALAALTLRALHAAWPQLDPREAEGVVLVDDADAHLDAAARRALLPALREALPRVQWILSAASPEVALACDPGDVLALRRNADGEAVTLYEGDEAMVH